MEKLIALQSTGLPAEQILAHLQSGEAIPVPEFTRQVATQSLLGDLQPHKQDGGGAL